MIWRFLLLLIIVYAPRPVARVRPVIPLERTTRA